MSKEKQAIQQKKQQAKRPTPTQEVAPVAELTPALTGLNNAAQLNGLPSIPSSRPIRQATVLQMQQTHGNMAVQRHLAQRNQGLNKDPDIDVMSRDGKTPEKVTLDQLPILGQEASHDSDTIIVNAGISVCRNAPDGLGFITSQGGPTSLGVSGGLTLIKNATAFSPPTFSTQTSAIRTGSQVEHFAVVQPTTSRDATHDSHYPGPGNHVRLGMQQRIRGRTYRYYWYISRSLSALIEQGEQEHLDDALRAYNLTYGLISREINGLTSQRFGPAPTPADAEALALAELGRRLPRQLGTHPANWVQILNTLLQATRIPDSSGWHSLDIGPPRTRGSRIILPVSTTSSTRIGQVPSNQVVNYVP